MLVDPATRYDHDGPDAHPTHILGSEADGGFAELVVVDAERAHVVDGSPLSDVELAALPIAYLGIAPKNLAIWITGWILFRLFDITKPWPIRRYERLPVPRGPTHASTGRWTGERSPSSR